MCPGRRIDERSFCRPCCRVCSHVKFGDGLRPVADDIATACDGDDTDGDPE
jgi:hypothetical protein